MRKTRTRPRKGLNRVRAGLLTAVAACAVSAVAVSSAQAVTIGTLNYGWTTVGPPAAANPLFKLEVLDGSASSTATLTGDVSGLGVITNGHIAFPNRTFSGAPLGLGPASTVTLGFAETPANSLTGQAGPNPGQLAVNGKYLLKITLAGNNINPILDGECDYTISDQTTPANDLVMSTENTSAPSAYPGRRFVSGPGSVAGSLHTATTGGPVAATCATFNTNLDNKSGDLWLGNNSIPTNGVQYSQVIDFSRLNVGAASGLSIIGSTPAVYRGIITGTAPALVTDPTPTTSTISIDPAALWSGSTMQGLDLTPSPGSFAGHTVAVDLEVQSGTTIAGTFDASNGQELLGTGANDKYKTTVDLDSGGTVCKSEPDPLDLSTEKTTTTDPFGPRDGVRFAGLGGNGAMMDSWPNLPAFVVVTGTQANCDSLGSLTVGLPGGLWFSHGINPNAVNPPGPDTTTTVPPPPPATTTTKKKKCKKGFKKVKKNGKIKCKKIKKKK